MITVMSGLALSGCGANYFFMVQCNIIPWLSFKLKRRVYTCDFVSGNPGWYCIWIVTSGPQELRRPPQSHHSSPQTSTALFASKRFETEAHLSSCLHAYKIFLQESPKKNTIIYDSYAQDLTINFEAYSYNGNIIMVGGGGVLKLWEVCSHYVNLIAVVLTLRPIITKTWPT